jgi:4-aminobutyrate aminotransferase-like enzyme
VIRTGLLSSLLAPRERPTLSVARGQGMELTLTDGRTVLDAGSLSSCLLGHCHPALVAAIGSAAASVYVNDATGYGPRERAAQDLLNLGFGDEPWADAVVFTVSSSEASDLALMLSQMLTGRTELVSRELSYHGGVGLAREVSTHPLWSAGLLADTSITLPLQATPVRRLPAPDCGHGLTGMRDHDCLHSCLKEASGLLRDAAAVIMDSSQGGVVPSPAYQDKLAALAQNAGALWIADETVTGFGRIGHMFGFQRGRARPDMVVLGKGITGGSAPGGALILSRQVVEDIGHRRWMTSSTFRGHPLTVSVVSALVRTLLADGLVDEAAAHAAVVESRLADIVARRNAALASWGEGMLWFVELAAKPEHAEASWRGGGSQAPITDQVQQAALERGSLIGKLSGNLMWLIPPLIATPTQLTRVCDALEGALAELDEGVSAH